MCSFESWILFVRQGIIYYRLLDITIGEHLDRFPKSNMQYTYKLIYFDFDPSNNKDRIFLIYKFDSLYIESFKIL